MAATLFICFLILSFGFVVLFGAPYVPTRKAQANQALDLLSIKKGEVFVDLGSGDGVMLLIAARRGYICYGYELNPILCLVAYIRTLRYRKNVHIRCKNFWNTALPKNTKGVYVFLLQAYMARLDAKLQNEAKGCRLVSYAFAISGKRETAQTGPMRLYSY